LVLFGLVATTLAAAHIPLALSGHKARLAHGRVGGSETPRPALAPVDCAGPYERIALSKFLAQRYALSSESAHSVVSGACGAGKQFDLDPLLLLAVMAIESRFNPAARGAKGATGLMQVRPRQHRDQLERYGGRNAIHDSMINIAVGAQILKEYIDRTGGVKAGLRRYLGTHSRASNSYIRKVLAERERLRRTVAEGVVYASTS
jgi:soluble lytic murein transglycosylase-like protein